MSTSLPGGNRLRHCGHASAQPACHPDGPPAGLLFLQLTEGIALGFAAVAVATQLHRQDVRPAEIGAFVASFYLPWAFKWTCGPFIEVFTSERLGLRRGWILGTQRMLIITLLACTGLNLPAQRGLLTGLLTGMLFIPVVFGGRCRLHGVGRFVVRPAGPAPHAGPVSGADERPQVRVAPSPPPAGDQTKWRSQIGLRACPCCTC